jgi:hypothetical protein
MSKALILTVFLAACIPGVLGAPKQTGAAQSSTSTGPKNSPAAPKTAIPSSSPVPDSWIGQWAGAFFDKKDIPPEFVQLNPFPALDKVIIAHLQPWALARQQTTESVFDDTGAVCGITGFFRQYIGTGFGFELIASPNRITLVSTASEEAPPQRIYFNSSHPDDLAPSWMGDSRAHWEGDTLVVDVTGFNDKSWLSTESEPHTEELHIIERMRLVGNGKILEIKAVLDDRKAFTSPYMISRYFAKMPDDAEPEEKICDEYPEENPWQHMRARAFDKHQQELDKFMMENGFNK